MKTTSLSILSIASLLSFFACKPSSSLTKDSSGDVQENTVSEKPSSERSSEKKMQEALTTAPVLSAILVDEKKPYEAGKAIGVEVSFEVHNGCGKFVKFESCF